jgi:hypothetical protein
LLVAVAAGAAWNGAWGDTMVLATICAVLVLRLLSEGARAMSAFVAIVKGLPEDVFVVHRTSGRSKGRETPKRDKASEGSETP